MGATKAKVTGAASTEFQAGVSKNDDISRQIVEGFKIGQMSLNEAVGLKDVPSMGQVLQTLTLFENTDAFTALMPMEETKMLRTQMDIVKFLPTMSKRNPERTRAHTVQQRRTRIFATLERFSIGLEVTYPSLDDSEGMLAYEKGLEQMLNASIEGNAMRMLAELQTCQTQFRNPLVRYGSKRALTVQHLKEAFDLEKQFFGIMQREGNAFEKLEALIAPIMKRHRGQANTYIADTKMITHQNLAIPENTLFYLGGPEAVARYRHGPRSISAGPNGTAIVGFQGYDIDNDSPAIEPLTEYIDYMEYNAWRDLDYDQPGDPDYATSHRDIMIFDVDSDRWARIGAAAVIDGCFRFDPESGAPYGINDPIIGSRHPVHYSANHMVDSFHFKGADGKLNPILLNGSVSEKDTTHEQIKEKAGVGAAYKLKNVYAGTSAEAVESAIQRGIDALATIDNAAASKEAIAYIKAALDGVADGQAIDPENAFASAAPNLYAQQLSNSVRIPREPKAPGGIPVGFGNWPGFAQIESEVSREAGAIADGQNAAGSAIAAYSAATGIGVSLLQDIVSFVRVVRNVVKNVRQFYPSSLAVDANYASPWHANKSPEATFFEQVVAPRPRSPIVYNGVVSPLTYTPNTFDQLGAGFSYWSIDGNSASSIQPLAGTHTAGVSGLPVARNLAALAQGRAPARVAPPATQQPASDQQGGDLQALMGASGIPSAGATKRREPDTPASFTQAKRPGFKPMHAKLTANLNSPNMVANWKAIDNDDSLTFLQKWMAKTWLLTLFNGKALKIAAKKNMPLLFNALLFRCMTLATDTIIKVRRSF
jgi:hypothetical protein